MTIDARLADGTVLRFPAGTADDVVDRAVQDHLARSTPRAVPDLPRLIPGQGLQRSIMNGLTFGFRDELAAGINSMLPGSGTYSEELSRARGEDAAYARDNPVASTAGNVVGGVIGPGVALRGAQAGAGLLTRLLRSAPSRGAVAGATGGAATGFGEGEGLAGRLEGAAAGGGVGAAAGGVLGAGLNIGARIGGRALDVAGLRNSEVAADRQILRALSRDGVDPAALASRVQQAPPESIIADLGGRNTVGLAAVAGNTPGDAMQAADRVVQLRRAGAPDRIAQASDAAFGGGSGTGVADEAASLRQTRTATAQPLYERAFAQPAPDSPALREIMDLPIVRQSVDASMANQRMAAVGRGEAFDPSPMRVLDAAKRGLDERIGATLDPVTGRIIPGRGEENQALTALRNRLVQELDTVPDYAAARAAWAGPTASMDAMDLGQRSLRMNRDTLATAAGRLGPSDQDFLRLGAGRAVTDMASDPARAAGAARRLTEDAQMQARLETLIPDPAQRATLVAALQREVQTASTNAAISPRAGSQTARLLAGADDMAVDPPGGLVMSLLNAGRQGGVGGAVSQGLSALYRRGQGINSSTADSLAARLMSMDPTQNAATATRLTERQQRDLVEAGMRQDFMARLLRGVGGAAAQDNR